MGDDRNIKQREPESLNHPEIHRTALKTDYNFLINPCISFLLSLCLFLRERGHTVKQEDRAQPALKQGPGGGRRNELLYISAATKERAERGEAAQ